MVLARFWWTEAPLSETSLADIVIQRNADLPTLVYGFLGAIGFYEDHLWQIRQPQGPLGKRKVGTKRIWVAPREWTHYECPEHLALEPYWWTDTSAWLDAAEHPVQDIAAGDQDEAWLWFDYGDHHTFRIRFWDLTTNRNAAVAARHALAARGIGTHLTAPVVLRAVHIDQYPL